jgi:hypothetical protein
VNTPAASVLVVVCAWCPGGRKETAKHHAAGAVVSHTMCAACVVKIEAELVQHVEDGDGNEK